MAFPSSVGSKQDDLQRAWDAVRGAAGQIKVNAQNLNTASAAGPVEAARILRFAATLADANDVLSRYTGVPGLLAYVREQINDPAVDVVAEYNAMLTQINATRDWIIPTSRRTAAATCRANNSRRPAASPSARCRRPQPPGRAQDPTQQVASLSNPL